MGYYLVQDRKVRDARRGIERLQGLRRSVLRLSGYRLESVLVPLSHLRPVDASSARELQDPNGNFYFLPGYSQVGGGDIIE